jgi:polypeptide N-acetylgalactosaminyltransferase
MFVRWKLAQLAKFAIFIAFFWLLFILFYPTFSELESNVKSLKHFEEAINEQSSEFHPKSKASNRSPNAIVDQDQKGGGGYVNSKKLQERLKPKLITRQPITDNETGKVLWNDLGAAKSAIDVAVREEGYKTFAFNTLVSSRIGVRRDIPDTRHKECKKLNYPSDLPTASVIICFYHEEYWTLLRTVHSVIDRTPERYLKEVILVNDRSDIDITANLTEHFKREKLESKVRIITPDERLGLIKARIFGSRNATGDALVFLDSHVECNVEWLEPLLARIKADRTNVVTPIIDIISADTFQYEPSPLVRGGFNWGLNFKWDAITKDDLQTSEAFAQPMKSPTMAGGLFAMERKYFRDLGEYDPGLEIWGGENLELSFRVWMCGGSLDIIPCSRVGHVFRKRRPYGASEVDSMVRNSLRVARVWMDGYIDNYFKVNPNARHVDYGNVDDRMELRRTLGCKDFKWYLDNIYPDLLPPSDEDDDQRRARKTKEAAGIKLQPWYSRSRNYNSVFSIRLKKSVLCIRSKGNEMAKKSELVLAPCLRNREYTWYETDKKELVLAKLLCLDASGKDRRPRLMKCHELKGGQEWKFRDDQALTAIYNMAAGLCLTVDGRRAGAKVEMDVCSEEDSHMWELVMNEDREL